MLLREYLYVDTNSFRGLLAQMESGVEETETTTKKSDKRTGGGVKGFAEHTESWGNDNSITKSLGDAVFPRLERALESEGLLSDISEDLRDPQLWTNKGTRYAFPEGRIVRVTAPGWLIDSRFISSMLTDFAVTHRGLVNMGVFPADPPKAPQKGRPRSDHYRELPKEDEAPEARIPLGALRFGPSDSDPMTGEQLRGITQIARGIFQPGLQLNLVPEAEGSGAISIRLQEGRQFLDSDPEVLFARYGVGPQEWTVVGTVGHHPSAASDMSDTHWATSDGIDRAAFARYITGLGAHFGNTGFTDLAQEPGFTVVPWAVYRTIGRASELGNDLL